MIAYNIIARKEFYGKGKHHKVYNKIGHIKYTESGKLYLQLFHLPQTDFILLPPEEKPNKESD